MKLHFQKKLHKYRASFFALFAVFAFTFALPVNAASVQSDATTTEPDYDWNYYSGVVSFNAISNALYLNFAGLAPVASDGSEYNIAVYQGHTPTTISFTQEKDYTYNGYLEKWVWFYANQGNPAIVSESVAALWLSDVVLPDGVTLSVTYQALEATRIQVKYRLQFSEYRATYTGDYKIYATTNMQTTCQIKGTTSSFSGLYKMHSASAVDDWTGDLKEYPFYSKDSGFSGSVIVGQQEGNALLEDQNTLIGNQTTVIQNQTSVIENQTSTIIDQTNQVMHGYSNDSLSGASSDFGNSAGQYNDAESSLFGQSSALLADFDFSAYGFEAFGTQFVAALAFVSSFLQSLYTKSPGFNTIVTLGLVLGFAFIVIGVTRFTINRVTSSDTDKGKWGR